MKTTFFHSMSVHTEFPSSVGKWPYVIVVLFVLYAISYPFSVVTIDTGRDWALAYQIASGSHFPAQGPVFKEVIHFGPIWFYLLGLFLFLTKTVTGTTLLLGCMAALKFWLAYAAGKTLLNRQFGLLWSFALALPSWSFMTQVTLTTFNYIEVTTLWVIYALIRYHKGGSGAWLVNACFAFSMALHAHPSTAPLGLIVLAFYGYHFINNRRYSLRLLVAGAVVFLIPFIPYLIFQHLQGWVDFSSAQEYVQSDVKVSILGSIPLLLTGTVLLPAQVIAQYLIPDYGVLRDFWIAIVYLLYVIGLLGIISLIFDRRRRTIFVIVLACLALVIPILLIIRLKTTFYMVFVLLPFLGGLWALAVSSLLQRLSWGRRVVFNGILLLILILFASATTMIIQTALNGYGSFPRGVFMDIKKPDISLDNPGYSARFPSYLHDDMSNIVCKEEGVTYLHGDLAFITDTSYGIGLRLHCERTADSFRITGQGDTTDSTINHLATLPELAWNQLRTKPEQWLGKQGFATPKKVVNPLKGHKLPPLDLYPPHEWAKQAGSKAIWQFTTAASDVLVISNVTFWYLAAQVIEVSANGNKLSPFHQSAVSTLYRCKGCKTGTVIDWSVKIATPKPDWIDIFTLADLPGK